MSERVGDEEREREGEQARGREANNTADSRPLSLLHSQRTEAETETVEADRMEEEDRTIHLQLRPRHWEPPSGTIRPSWEQNRGGKKGKTTLSVLHKTKYRTSTPAGLITTHRHTPHYFSPLSLTHTLTLSNWSTFRSLLPFGPFFFLYTAFRWPSELSGFTFILWRTMGLGWRGAAGTLRIRTEGSWYLLVTLLLFCGFWKARTQTDDEKSVYFWETGTAAKPLIRDYIWSLVLHMERLWW